MRAAFPALGMRRANRLRAPDEFSFVYRSGTRARGSAVTVIAAPGGSAPPRIGVVCSRTVGDAPTRSRIKRRLRAAVDPLVGRVRPGNLVVLQGQRGAATAPFGDLRRDVEDGLRRAGALDA